MRELMDGARFPICPSEWYEPFGRVVIEAFSRSVPVLAARIGGLEELVDHDRTGRFFRSGDPEDLARQAGWLLSHDLAVMRRAARRQFERHYSADQNYACLMAIYRRAIDAAAAPPRQALRPAPTFVVGERVGPGHLHSPGGEAKEGYLRRASIRRTRSASTRR